MNSIRFTPDHLAKLRNSLLSHAPAEAAGFLLAGWFETDSGVHFVVRELMIPESKDYDIQAELRLQVSPVFFNRVISRAEREELAVVMCHTHPFSNGAWFSPADDYGEAISAKTLHECLNGRPTASLVIDPASIAARIWKTTGLTPEAVDEVSIVGRRLVRIPLSGHAAPQATIDLEMFSRQVMALGREGQVVLSELKVGIVGTGGTGSSVAELLARLGVRHFVLVDPDNFEPSNITRVFGSHASDISSKRIPKVAIARRNILSVAPKAEIQSLAKTVVDQRVLQLLSGCDVIFSCVDRHAPRSVLNELAYQNFIPVIDLGVGLASTGNLVTGGTVRATLVSPGLPCLWDYGIVRADVMTAELLPTKERTRRTLEGYVPALDETAPSVVSFTATCAGLGVTLLLDLLFGILGDGSPNLVLELNPLRMGRLGVTAGEDCVCRVRMGRGATTPLSAP